MNTMGSSTAAKINTLLLAAFKCFMDLQGIFTFTCMFDV